MSNVLHFFQLFFDDYAETGCLDPSRDAPRSKTSEAANSDAPVVPDSIKMEIEDLRQQLQLLKKQAMTALDQARKSSEREQTALIQAQESAHLEQAATLKAARAAERENYMLELMIAASQNMAGTHLFPNYLTRKILSDNHLLCCFPFTQVLLWMLLPKKKE